MRKLERLVRVLDDLTRLHDVTDNLIQDAQVILSGVVQEQAGQQDLPGISPAPAPAAEPPAVSLSNRPLELGRFEELLDRLAQDEDALTPEEIQELVKLGRDMVSALESV